MYSAFHLAAKYIKYYLTASNGKGHGIHSPFVFDFIIHVLNDKKKYPAYILIEQQRKKMLADKRILEIEDFGAGSTAGNHKKRSIDSIARSALKSKKLGQLLFRIAKHYQPATMLELGTSLGLSAAYLASGHPPGKLITCEGAAAVASIAKENFTALGIKNIETVTGSFDHVLPGILKNTNQLQLVFIDGNHRKAPTLQYFHQIIAAIQMPAIVIFDDIHWSVDMEEAWQEIKDHSSVILTVDLFFMGLVFFSPDFKVKQDFILRF